MKRIIFFISLLVGLSAAAQEPVNTYLGGLNTKTIVRNDLQIDSLLYLPLRDTNFTPLRKGILIFRSTDSALYVSTSTVAASKWTKVGATPSGGAWGTITGTLSSQTDLVAALAAKQNLITTGTTSQYIRGDLSLGTLSSAVTSITDPLYSPVAHSHSGLIPIGGSTNQVLTKNSSTNYDYSWQDPSAGSGTVTNVSGGLWIGGGPITTTGSLNVDSAALFTYGLRRKDSVAGGYYPYSSNPKNYLTSSTIPLTNTYIGRGNVSNVLYGDAGLTYNGTVMYVGGILNPSQYVATKWYRLAPLTTPDIPNTFDNPGIYYNQDSLKYGVYFPDTDSWRYTDFLASGGGLGSSAIAAMISDSLTEAGVRDSFYVNTDDFDPATNGTEAAPLSLNPNKFLTLDTLAKYHGKVVTYDSTGTAENGVGKLVFSDNTTGSGILGADSARFNPTDTSFVIYLGGTGFIFRQPGSSGPTTTYDPDAEAFFTATGITDETQKEAVDAFVKELKADGTSSTNKWGKMKALYPFVGGTSATHKYNLKDPQDTDAAYRITFTGSFTHNSSGVTPASSSTSNFADTHFEPNTGFTISNSAALGFYSATNFSTDEQLMGAYQDGTGADAFQIANYSDFGYFQAGNQAEASPVAPSNWSKLLAVSRNGSTTVVSYRDGTSFDTNVKTFDNSVTIPIYIWGRNNGSGGTSDSPGGIGSKGAFISDGLSAAEMLDVATAFNNLNTALGR